MRLMSAGASVRHVALLATFGVDVPQGPRSQLDRRGGVDEPVLSAMVQMPLMPLQSLFPQLLSVLLLHALLSQGDGG